MGRGKTRKPATHARPQAKPAITDLRLKYVYSGMDTGHAPGFAIDRPQGWHNYLFLRFRTPMEVLTATGRGTAEPGDCLIYAPGQPQWYRGRGVPFRDDWMHIEGTLVPELLAKYSLPVGRIFTPRASEFFPILLSEMLQAKLRKPPLWEDEIALAFHSLVMHLARALVEPSTNDGAVISSPQVITVQTVRLSVHQDLRRSWTIAAMARLAGVSPARFTAWYRAVFGATPIDDLIRARVERACWLLKTGEQSLAEISADCGFSDVYYFSRQFRKRIGITPGKYRMSARLR